MKLQSTNLDLNEAVILFMTTLRDSFDDFEKKGMLPSKSNSYKSEMDRKHKLKLNDGATHESEFSHTQGRREGGAEGVICPRASDIQGPPMLVVNAPMVRGGGLYPTVMPRASICLSAALVTLKGSWIEVFSPILDRLHTEINKCLEAYINLSNKFGFLHNVQQLDTKQLRGEADSLVQLYPEDLGFSSAEEPIHFRAYLKRKFLTYDGDDAVSNELRMYRILTRRGMREVFPNVEIALQICLTLMVCNCSSERSFSALKGIKGVLRSTMNDQKLNNLIIVNIETNILR